MMKNISIKLLLFLLPATLLIVAAGNKYHSGLKLNKEKSVVTWTGNKVTGSHTGRLGIKDGTITMHGDHLEGVMITFDMNNITCTDLEDATWNKKLVDHLKNGDFFDVANHPTGTFKSTKIETSAVHDYKVTGDLTLKGITHSISFPVHLNYENGKAMAAASLTFDRTKWNIKYNSGSFFEGLGDKMINDEVEVKFDVVTQ